MSSISSLCREQNNGEGREGGSTYKRVNDSHLNETLDSSIIQLLMNVNMTMVLGSFEAGLYTRCTS